MTVDLMTRKDLEEYNAKFYQQIMELVMPLKQSKPLLKPKQVMAEINVSPNILKKLEDEGILMPIRKIGHRLYRAEDVENFKRGE
jgi:hypothetical protein